MITALLMFIILQSDSVNTLIVESSAVLFRKGSSLTVQADGTLAVVDQGSNTLSLVSAANTVTATVGGKGSGNDSFDLPSDVSSSFLLDLFLVDQNNRRVLRFDKQLNVVHMVGDDQTVSRTGMFQPVAAAVSSRGDLYVLERDQKRVAVFNSRGQYLHDFGTLNGSRRILSDPRDIAISASDEIFVLDNDLVLRFDIFGNMLAQYELTSESVPVSLSIGNNAVIVTSSDLIAIIPVDTGVPTMITRSSIIGENVTDNFVDTYLSGETCIILTTHSIIRCSIRSMR